MVNITKRSKQILAVMMITPLPRAGRCLSATEMVLYDFGSFSGMGNTPAAPLVMDAPAIWDTRCCLAWPYKVE
jgi:hypothetical protein